MRAYGYIRIHFLMSETELTNARKLIVEAAQAGGVQLVTIRVEEIEASPDGQPLVVPTLHHLAVLRHPTQIRDHVRHCTHEVLIATKPAERTR